MSTTPAPAGSRPFRAHAGRARWCRVLAMLGLVVGNVIGASTTSGNDVHNAPERVVALRSPFNTLVQVDHHIANPHRLEATVVVPADAPRDLGVSAFVSDTQGLWFRSTNSVTLSPGRHFLRFALDAQATLIGEPHRAAWTPSVHARMTEAGLFFWSQQSSQALLQIERLEVIPSPTPITPTQPALGPGRLHDLYLDGHDLANQVIRCHTGQRWTLRVRPDPFPTEPYREEVALELTITAEDGQERRIPGFYRQPMRIEDRGDGEICTPTAAAWYEVRYRPSLPGRYHLRLTTTWSGQTQPLVTTLPDLLVSGEPWDDFVRVDTQDPRFFATGGRIGPGQFFWPIGLNLHSVWDTLSQENFGTVLTPNRLLAAYEAYLRRFAAAGGTAVEIWLASWSLSLEWRGDWSGFHGIGRYHEGNAERLDRILDLAYQLGIRVNLVVNNHGQASTDEDREWENNPYNAVLGGPLAHAAEYFTDPRALAGQERYRRYLVARWADHPGVMGWKLWSEENLTEGRGNLPRWHQQATARWQSLDGYGHPLTTHWCSTYRDVDSRVARLPGMGYLCIDAYHHRGFLLAQLVWDSLCARDGLRRFNKPILITEYGGDCKTCPAPQLIAELGSAPWAALMSGNAGAPMVWWCEWVDQHDHWAPYRAISAFLAHEDLRGSGQASTLATRGGNQQLWSRAWVSPGHLLGYCLVQDWGTLGRVCPPQRDVVIHIGDQVAAGSLSIEWWNADQGRIVSREHVKHPGGVLDLHAPEFINHLAYKLSRLPSETPSPGASINTVDEPPQATTPRPKS